MSAVTSKDGTTIAYEQAGTGPALVMVDAAGNFSGFRAMDSLAGVLAAAFTVFTYDRRGRGASGDTLPYAVDREVEDLHAVLDAAGGSAFVYGFSSGAVLALHAAARGLPITKLALFEPPIRLEGDPPSEGDLGAEITALVTAGRRGDAVELFNTSIGVPAEMMAGMRQSPAWPAMESVAHTLAYDCVVADSFAAERLATITTPTLVLQSAGSDDDLDRWARGVAGAMPHAAHRSLAGGWHGVAAEDLLPALKDFFPGT